MRDLLILLAASWSLYGLCRWHRWYWPTLILAAVSVIEPDDEPEPEPVRLAIADVTVADVRWGRATWAASRYDLVHPTGDVA